MPRSSSMVLLFSLLFLLGAATLSVAAERPWSPVQNGFVEKAPTVWEYAPGRILVQLTPDAAERAIREQSLEVGKTARAVTGVAALDASLSALGIRSIRHSYQPQKNRELARQLGADRRFILESDQRVDAMEAARILASNPHVESASVDWRAFPAAVPNDPLYTYQWGHNNTAQMLSYDWATHSHENGSPVGTVGFDSNAEAAWELGYGDTGVIIAILDSGVDIDHPDLRLVAGYDFGDNDTNPDDDSNDPGHGTACAGVAAAMAQNALGASGIAGGASIMPCKVANNQGSMYFSAIQDALYWAADNGADIISMSLGALISSDAATDAALSYAYNAGVVILAATGNENGSTIHYPAIHDLVIGVGAASPCGERKRSSSSSLELNPGVYADPNGYTCDGERWWGSNYGSTTQDDRGAVDVIAPTIMPTTDIGGSGGYDPSDYSMWFNGTSCSTPYAAGVCALILSANPGFTPAQTWDRLTSTAQDVTSVESGTGWDRYTGYGMVDAAAAVGGGGPVAPVAAFSGAPLSGSYPLDVSFTDQSSGTPTSWSWTFGDGGTSTAQNPVYTYTDAGNYTVSLSVSNAVGSDAETKLNYITVTEPGAVVVSSALADLPSLGTVSGSYLNTWTADGSYEVLTETISDNHPRKTTSWMEHAWRFDVTAGVAVDFKLRASGPSGDGDTFVFAWSTDQATWNTLVTVSSATLQDYTVAVPASTSGTVYVRVIDTNRVWGATVLDAVTVDYLAFETDGGAPQAPVADFSGTPTSGDYPLAVSFSDQSSGTPTSWSWTFGDGGTSTAQNPSYSYTVAGTYTVSLSVSNAVGSDSITKLDYITVTEPGTGGDTMHVADLVITRKVAGPNVNGIATVTIHDANSAAVASATVTLLATGPVSGTYSGLTTADGTLTVQTGKVKNPSGEWCFEVTNVTHATLSYDSGANVVTKACESGVVFGAGAERELASFVAQPNPFNPATEIRFGLAQAGTVRLELFDVRGRRVSTLLNRSMSAGNHVVMWRPTDTASGVYYARLVSPEGVQTLRLLLLK